ncbi:TPA: hypothetical protein DEP34_00585 [Candidatus Uhrbacteria bacterium]|uniref:Uncharacterized protein n=2 Tax=Candidatus Uhriibacteriota TaxID=1752732 RepID=A0A0G1Q8R7_9BACT|nr:MAG: hypothetical protein UX45_C0003G0036 [Candidatus Uhrbacteria bacterium GW2011_GWF2_46_218]KKU41207.1 MAG: hypothetical protein UX57_C0005G0037 [Candidatus Uhrbacteria bacterium GW2011_GWE2_46_68]HBK34055.1 hypothetical protein [Candidatus Uhrbacteria bacterium]HCB18867.1 hypothetical protein [Candidatus Uhrbacteria bacterium]
MSFAVPKQKRLFVGHESYVRTVRISNNGRRIVSMGENQFMRFWHGETGVCCHQRIFSIPVEAFALSPNGNLLIVGENQSLPKIFSLNDPHRDPQLLGQRIALCRIVAFSPDGTCVFCSGDGYQTYIWNVLTEELVLDIGEIKRGRSVESAVFSPNGQFVAIGYSDDMVIIIDIHTRQVKQRLTGHKSRIHTVAFSPDGNLMASGSEDTTVKIWDVETAQQCASIEHGSIVYGVAFSPDGKLIASGSSDCSLRFWSTDTWQEKGRIEGFVQSVCSFCFSQDWSRLVVNTHNDPSVKDQCTLSVFDFDGPNLGSLSPEEAAIYI